MGMSAAYRKYKCYQCEREIESVYMPYKWEQYEFKRKEAFHGWVNIILCDGCDWQERKSLLNWLKKFSKRR